MKIKIPGYNGNYRIMSLATDEKTKDDLNSENVNMLYVTADDIRVFPDDIILTKERDIVNRFRDCNNYDVFELFEDGMAYRCYDDSSSENVFFITEKCNSNCTMCPMPDFTRKRGNTSNIDNLIEIASHIPSDVPYMTITGGEPFMVGKELFRLLKYCREKFEHTEFQLLTNGRIFAIEEYTKLIRETMPNHLVVGIPIHGSCAEVHDMITRTPDSFNQTIKGLVMLQELCVPTEIRIVVCRDNASDLNNIAKLIAEKMGRSSFVSIMAMEMTGNAHTNKNKVWISYRESFQYVRPAVETLIKAGIDVRLYNFPLCTVDRDMWLICFKSISSWKVRYDEICEECSVKKACGGVFAGTIQLEHEELEPVI